MLALPASLWRALAPGLAFHTLSKPAFIALAGLRGSVYGWDGVSGVRGLTHAEAQLWREEGCARTHTHTEGLALRALSHSLLLAAELKQLLPAGFGFLFLWK